MYYAISTTVPCCNSTCLLYYLHHAAIGYSTFHQSCVTAHPLRDLIRSRPPVIMFPTMILPLFLPMFMFLFMFTCSPPVPLLLPCSFPNSYLASVSQPLRDRSIRPKDRPRGGGPFSSFSSSYPPSPPTPSYTLRIICHVLSICRFLFLRCPPSAYSPRRLRLSIVLPAAALYEILYCA